jgi:hypothetical protein
MIIRLIQNITTIIILQKLFNSKIMLPSTIIDKLNLILIRNILQIFRNLNLNSEDYKKMQISQSIIHRNYQQGITPLISKFT